MGISGNCRTDGGVLGYLPEAVGGLYKAGLFRIDRRGDAGQLRPAVAGHEDAAPGHGLRHLDGHRRAGRGDRGSGAVQGAGHRVAHVLCRPAADRHRGAEDHLTVVKAGYRRTPRTNVRGRFAYQMLRRVRGGLLLVLALLDDQRRAAQGQQGGQRVQRDAHIAGLGRGDRLGIGSGSGRRIGVAVGVGEGDRAGILQIDSAILHSGLDLAYVVGVLPVGQAVIDLDDPQGDDGRHDAEILGGDRHAHLSALRAGAGEGDRVIGAGQIDPGAVRELNLCLEGEGHLAGINAVQRLGDRLGHGDRHGIGIVGIAVVDIGPSDPICHDTGKFGRGGIGSRKGIDIRLCLGCAVCDIVEAIGVAAGSRNGLIRGAALHNDIIAHGQLDGLHCPGEIITGLNGNGDTGQNRRVLGDVGILGVHIKGEGQILVRADIAVRVHQALLDHQLAGHQRVGDGEIAVVILCHGACIPIGSVDFRNGVIDRGAVLVELGQIGEGALPAVFGRQGQGLAGDCRQIFAVCVSGIQLHGDGIETQAELVVHVIPALGHVDVGLFNGLVGDAVDIAGSIQTFDCNGAGSDFLVAGEVAVIIPDLFGIGSTSLNLDSPGLDSAQLVILRGLGLGQRIGADRQSVEADDAIVIGASRDRREAVITVLFQLERGTGQSDAFLVDLLDGQASGIGDLFIEV